jgi:uncharacterized oligopeptide transporter (OPT) family protein
VKERLLTLRALAAGSALGAFLCVVNVMVALKSGLGFGGAQVAALAGYFWLRATGGYSTGENNIIQAAASGAYLSLFAMDSALAAHYLARGVLLPWPLFLGLNLAAVALGIMMAVMWRESFIGGSGLPFPTGTAAAELILSLDRAGGGRSRYLFLGALAGAAIALVVGLGWVPATLPGPLLPAPAWIGLALSPILFGMGYIVGWRNGAAVAGGSFISAVVWLTLEGARCDLPFSAHVLHPVVLSGGTTLLVMSALLTMVAGQRALRPRRPASTSGEAPAPLPAKAPGALRRAPSLPWWGLAVPALAAAGLFFVLSRDVSRTLLILAVLLPLCAAGGVFCTRAAGETGLVPAASLGVMTFLLGAVVIRSWEGLLFTGAFVSATGLATLTMMNTFRAGDILHTPPAPLAAAQGIGAASGVVAGTLGIYALARVYGLGSEALPAPVSVAWGTLVEGLSAGRVPLGLDLRVALGAALVAALLQWRGISPVCLGVGMIVSPAYGLAMFAGAALRLAFTRAQGRARATGRDAADLVERGQGLASGLIVGEGVVTLLLVIYRLVAG